MSRPISYTPELAAVVLERLADGESLRHICLDADMPTERIVRWWDVQNTAGFASQYARARKMGIDALMELALEDATAARKPEDVNGAKLAWDARRFHASRMYRERWGERLELAGDAAAPIVHSLIVQRLDKVRELPAGEDPRRENDA